MPSYRYSCAKCGEQFDVQQSFTDAALQRHSGCGGKLSKVFGTPGIVLKGAGFYKTDSGSRRKQAGATDSGSGTDSGASERKATKETATKEPKSTGPAGSGSDKKPAGAGTGA